MVMEFAQSFQLVSKWWPGFKPWWCDPTHNRFLASACFCLLKQGRLIPESTLVSKVTASHLSGSKLKLGYHLYTIVAQGNRSEEQEKRDYEKVIVIKLRLPSCAAPYTWLFEPL